jgi:hypothetical protein
VSEADELRVHGSNRSLWTRQFVAFGILAMLLAALTLGAPRAWGQAAQRSPEAAAALKHLEAAITRYYERPVDVVKLLLDWEQLNGQGREALMGFLAGLFVKYPAQIQTLAGAKLGRHGQVVVIQGLRLADRYPEALGAAAGWGWPQEQIAHITPVIPLVKAKAEHPSSFDVLWSASFATGDHVYVRPIFDHYAAVAARQDIDVRDIVTLVMARHRPNKEAVETIGKKYSRDVALAVIVAAAALWSLESNARQHKFVAAALDRYTQERPDTPAVKGLHELRASLKQR